MRSTLNLLLISYMEERLLGGSSSRLAGVERDDVRSALGHGCANYSILIFYLQTMTRCFTNSTKTVSNPIVMFLNILQNFIC